MNITDYLEEVRAKYASGQATEHSYRPALQSLFGSIDPALTVINEPKRSDTGMPDFLFQISASHSQSRTGMAWLPWTTKGPTRPDVPAALAMRLRTMKAYRGRAALSERRSKRPGRSRSCTGFRSWNKSG